MDMTKETTWGYKDLPDKPSTAYRRIADQIDFFDKRSKRNQNYYKYLKSITIIFAAIITASAAFPLPQWVIPVLGALIVILEGLMQLGSMLQNWLSYRNTCEALKHEKYLSLSKGGPYKDAEDIDQLLSERTEELLGKDRSTWITVQQDGHRKLARPTEKKS